jgi:DNA replication protein DnaC
VPRWILSVLHTGSGAVPRSALARADGSFRNLLARLSRTDVLVIDDWAMAPLAEPERRDFWEICEDRYQVRSLILTSQLPVTRWHEQIGDPTVADGILDRLVTTRTASRCAATRCAKIAENLPNSLPRN